MSKNQVIRIAVSVYGDNRVAHATSPTTRIWARGDDVYVSERQNGSTWKLSFHGARPGQPETWQMGYTQEHLRAELPPFSPTRSRLLAMWRPTPFVDHQRCLLVMDFYRGALCCKRLDEDAVQLQFPPDHEGFVRLYLLETDFDRPRKECSHQVTAPLSLASGRQLWTSWLQITSTTTGDQHPADAAVLVPGVVDEHGVAVPHLKVQGGTLVFDSFASHFSSCPWPPEQGPFFDFRDADKSPQT